MSGKKSSGSGGKGWSKPRTLVPDLSAPPLDQLPSTLRNFVRALAKSTQTPPDAALLSSVAILSAATRGTWAVVPGGGWGPQPLALYANVFMGSGTRKSAVWGRTAAPIVAEQRRQQINSQADREAAEARFELAEQRAKKAKRAALDGEVDDEEAINLHKQAEALRPPPQPQLMLNDATPEALAIEMAGQGGSMLVHSAEATFLRALTGRYSGDGRAVTELCNQAFDAEPYHPARVGRKAQHISSPFLSLSLATQTEIMAGVSNQDTDGSGFLARFLYAVPPSRVGRRAKNTPPVPAQIEDRWDDAVTRLVRLASEALGVAGAMTNERRNELTMTGKARREFDSWRFAHEKRIDPDTGDLAHIAAWASKLPGALVRLAALFRLLRNPHAEQVMQRDVVAALSLADYLIEHADAAFQIMRTPYSPGSEEHPILRFLRKERWESFQHSELYERVRDQRWCSTKNGSQAVRNALHELVDRGWVRPVQARQGRKGGRPPEVYETHPDLRERPPSA